MNAIAFRLDLMGLGESLTWKVNRKNCNFFSKSPNFFFFNCSFLSKFGLSIFKINTNSPNGVSLYFYQKYLQLCIRFTFHSNSYNWSTQPTIWTHKIDPRILPQLQPVVIAIFTLFVCPSVPTFHNPSVTVCWPSGSIFTAGRIADWSSGSLSCKSSLENMELQNLCSLISFIVLWPILTFWPHLSL